MNEERKKLNVTCQYCGKIDLYLVPAASTEGWAVKCHYCGARGPEMPDKTEAVWDWFMTRYVEGENDE